MEGRNIFDLVMSYVLTTSALLVMLSRILFRRLNHQKFLVDDYIVMVSMALYTVLTAVNSVVVRIHGLPPSNNLRSW